jgi:tRNA(fMet)-specific endonuclease VapC
MVSWMLDSDICVYAINDRPQGVRRRLATMRQEDVAVSSVVAAELWAGVAKSRERSRNARALSGFFSGLSVRDWPTDAAPIYGEIKAALERAGRLIGGMDMLIAAHALCENAVLVTNNQAEFRRVKGLRLENWAKA